MVKDVILQIIVNYCFYKTTFNWDLIETDVSDSGNNLDLETTLLVLLTQFSSASYDNDYAKIDEN